MYLIISSFHERSPKSKAGTLDRAVESMLNDIITKMREYSLGLHIPTLVLFSFGIIMPLMIIALFPLLGFFGIPLGLESITLFLFASLLGTYLYSNGILAKRPVTFILPEIETDVPRGYIKLGKSVLPALPFCAAFAIIVSGPTIFYLLSLSKAIQLGGLFASAINSVNTMPIIWGIGGAMIIYFWGSNWFKTAERKRIKQIEAQLPDALYYMRNVLSEGRTMEEALDFAGSMMGKTPLALQMRDASNLIKRRHITTEAVLTGRESPFERKSKLLQSTLFMLTAGLRGGIRSAAQTCNIMHNYMRRINKIERSLMEMLSRNLSMMRLTAMIFAPLVGAVITVLFALIVKGMAGATKSTAIMGFSTMSAMATPNIPTPVLQLILGLYVLGLNFVLVRYVTTIENGYDSVKMGMDLSTSLVTSLIIFTATLIALTSLLVGG
jgi:Flp pilus assembly protein TadB